MKKWSVVLLSSALLIFLLVGYQNCNKASNKKDSTINPVNPNSAYTKGIVDGSRLTQQKIDEIDGTYDTKTNTLTFSPQEPVFKVNCEQLDQIKKLLAPNILTVEYFKSGSIQIDSNGNITQVSVVNAPAAPSMVGDVPEELKSLQVVDSGVSQVQLTGGKKLDTVDLSKNYLWQEPIVPSSAVVDLDQNPVCENGQTNCEKIDSTSTSSTRYWNRGIRLLSQI